jgi:crotonobetainyl-CoA:carnitine CoA-transferase CaiB-like acyl-CoA transferase
LQEHTDFRTNDLRIQHRAAINAHIAERIAQAPKAYGIETLNAAGVPCGVVMNLAEVFPIERFLQVVAVQQWLDNGVGGLQRQFPSPIARYRPTVKTARRCTLQKRMTMIMSLRSGCG